jgi:hypothetical protein
MTFTFLPVYLKGFYWSDIMSDIAMTENNNRKSAPAGKYNAHDYAIGEKEEILTVAFRNMVMIDGKVYGLEDDSEPDAFVDCASKISSCKAGCCSLVFASHRRK